MIRGGTGTGDCMGHLKNQDLELDETSFRGKRGNHVQDMWKILCLVCLDVEVQSK